MNTGDPIRGGGGVPYSIWCRGGYVLLLWKRNVCIWRHIARPTIIHFRLTLRKVCIKFAWHWFLSDLLKLEHKLECMQILERKNEFEQEKNSYSVAFFPPPRWSFEMRAGWKTLVLIWGKRVWRLQYIGKTKRVAENISGLWNRIFPSRETEYFRPVKQNISVLWKISCGRKENAPWRKMYLLWQTTFPFCGSTYFYPVAERFSEQKGVVWMKICSALQLFCIKVLRKKRQP